jgi:hypothetical protein
MASHGSLQRVKYVIFEGPLGVLKEYDSWTHDNSKRKDGQPIDWDHILEHVPLEKKVWAGKVVMENFGLFDDGDHQVLVCADSGEYLRFYPVLYHQTILKNFDLNKVKFKVYEGRVPIAHYNKLLRDMGVSLSGYWDMRMKESEFEEDS